MALLTNKNVKIVGVSACVPKNNEENSSSKLLGIEKEAAAFISSTGIERHRIADAQCTTSDLCYRAAGRLLEELNWELDTIDALFFVSQTPDYILPATACILQSRLGLSKECYAVDISSGCSGWTYGLSLISNLLSTGCMKRGLLLSGETLSKVASPKDKTAWPLFGDAGTATALEYNIKGGSMVFHCATDGTGYDAILIPDGGFRNQSNVQSFDYDAATGRNRLSLILKGMDIFSFAINEVPDSVNKLLAFTDRKSDGIDYYLFHQANKQLNEFIRKTLRLKKEQCPYSLRNFGNTSSASIPLTMVTELREKLKGEKLQLMGCGFGVGLSWCSALFETENIVVPQLIEI